MAFALVLYANPFDSGKAARVPFAATGSVLAIQSENGVKHSDRLAASAPQ